MQCTLTADPEQLCPCTLCHCLCVLVWAHLHTWGAAEVWGGCCKKMLSPPENGFGKLFSALCTSVLCPCHLGVRCFVLWSPSPGSQVSPFPSIPKVRHLSSPVWLLSLLWDNQGSWRAPKVLGGHSRKFCRYRVGAQPHYHLEEIATSNLKVDVRVVPLSKEQGWQTGCT